LTARAFSLVDSYIYGFGRQQFNIGAGGDLTPEEIEEGFLQAIPVDEYPFLREIVLDYAMVEGYDDDADFEFGLDLILDGLQRLLERDRPAG
jgi:hypothetical protein